MLWNYAETKKNVNQIKTFFDFELFQYPDKKVTNNWHFLQLAFSQQATGFSFKLNRLVLFSYK